LTVKILRINFVYTFLYRSVLLAHMAKKKGKSKDSQLVICINVLERDQFVELCDEMDTSVARELRQFIRKFVAKHMKS